MGLVHLLDDKKLFLPVYNLQIQLSVDRNLRQINMSTHNSDPADYRYLKFQDTLKHTTRLVSRAENIIDIDCIYDEIADYPGVVDEIITSLKTLSNTLQDTFKKLLFPRIIQHVVDRNGYLSVVYINPERQEIHYLYEAYDNVNQKPVSEPWLIKLAEYDSIMHLATVIHTHYTKPINPSDNPEGCNLPETISTEIVTLSINSYEKWLHDNI